MHLHMNMRHNPVIDSIMWNMGSNNRNETAFLSNWRDVFIILYGCELFYSLFNSNLNIFCYRIRCGIVKGRVESKKKSKLCPLKKKNQSTDGWVDYWKLCVKLSAAIWETLCVRSIHVQVKRKKKKEKTPLLVEVQCQHYWILIWPSPISCETVPK